jgi:hypothetical protein
MLDPQSRERDPTTALQKSFESCSILFSRWALSKARAEELLDWLEGNGWDLALLACLSREGAWCVDGYLPFEKRKIGASSKGFAGNDVSEHADELALSTQH